MGAVEEHDGVQEGRMGVVGEYGGEMGAVEEHGGV